jgi:hypothetical protein
VSAPRQLSNGERRLIALRCECEADAAEPQVGHRRPKILGITIARHGDGGFTTP